MRITSLIFLMTIQSTQYYLQNLFQLSKLSLHIIQPVQYEIRNL
jgi:hypothetical protein